MSFPGGGVQNSGVGGIDGQIDGAGVFVTIQDLAPSFATIGGFVDAPLTIGTKGVPKGGHPDGVGVFGVDAHFGDVAGIGQAHVAPSGAGVG